MKNYLKRVRECVKDLNTFAELSLELETTLSKEESLEFGAAVIAEAKAVLKENRIPEIVEFLTNPEGYEGAMKIGEADENINLCHEAQEKAIAICGDWTEQTAILTLASFVLNGGLIEGVDTETVVTFGELFGLEKDHEDYAKLTNLKLSDLASKTFVGEGKTLPVDHAGEVKLGLIYQPENEKLKEVWESYNLDTLVGVPVANESITVLPTLDATEELISDFKETYNLSDDNIAEVKTRLETIAKLNSPDTTKEELLSGKFDLPKPELVVDLKEAVNEFLFGRSNSYLLELVAVVRTNNLTKEDIANASNKYKVFTKKSLEKLLVSVPEAKEVVEGNEDKVEKKEAVQEDIEQNPTLLENNNTEIAKEAPSTYDRLLEFYV